MKDIQENGAGCFSNTELAIMFLILFFASETVYKPWFQTNGSDHLDHEILGVAPIQVASLLIVCRVD